MEKQFIWYELYSPIKIVPFPKNILHCFLNIDLDKKEKVKIYLFIQVGIASQIIF